MRPKPSHVFFTILAVVASAASSRLVAQMPKEQPILGLASSAKFGPVPNVPDCFTVAVERGDPTKGPSVMLARFAPGCVAPFHWHTPSETAMMVSGALQTQMQGDKAIVVRRGDFVYLPSHHIHRATCTGSVPCLVFLSSDASFDVHWVDDAGQEISLDAAMKGVKTPAAVPVQKP